MWTWAVWQVNRSDPNDAHFNGVPDAWHGSRSAAYASAWHGNTYSGQTYRYRAVRTTHEALQEANVAFAEECIRLGTEARARQAAGG